MKVLLATMAVFGCVSALAAQTTRVLIPIWTPTPAPGAHGSLWKTELAILNSGPEPANIYGYDWGCTIPLCPPAPETPAGITFNPRLQASTDEVPAAFLLVDDRHRRHVHLSLRVRDLSRQANTWGTEIPVVFEDEFLSSSTQLLDVPVKPGFRQMLRLYDLDPIQGDIAGRIRIYGAEERVTPFARAGESIQRDVLLIDEVHPFLYATRGSGRADHPGYLQLADFGSRPEIGSFQRVRIQIDILGEGHRHWAFVAVTNNETQHVTTISPN